MKLFGFDIRREQRASAEDPTVPVSAENFLLFFGIDTGKLPSVSIDTALDVPAVWAAANFLPSTMAALPFHPYRVTKDGPEKITSGKLGVTIHHAPNDEWDAYRFWHYFWGQVFTGGRGLAWIERSATGIEALWPLEATKTIIKRVGLKLTYEYGGKVYPASDVIDVPYMLKPDQTGHYGPINKARKAIQLALAMNDYASGFFAGGGVPPLALTGPMPAGAEAVKRAQADIKRAVDAAKASGDPVFPIPAGYTLAPVGFDPAKGQMTEARLFQIQEIARAYQLPPVFLMDLSNGTFSNTEQQDLQLVKHLIAHWAKALEKQMNLKLFGRMSNTRYVEYNLDGLQRGDFKSRIEGIAQAITGGFMEPNRGRGLMNWPAHDNPAADELFIQGATVKLGSQATEPTPPAEPEADASGEAE